MCENNDKELDKELEDGSRLAELLVAHLNRMGADGLMIPIQRHCGTKYEVIVRIAHASDCAVHNGPALPVGKCDCGSIKDHG